MSGKLKLALFGAATLVGIIGVIGYVFFAPQSSRHVDQPETQDPKLPVLKQGSFSGADAAHDVSGRVQLRGTAQRLLLRFENYDATAGPDVFLYLSKSETFDPERALRVLVPGGGDSGQATLRGNFSVPVNTAAPPREYTRVVVWCERFGVKFGEAVLR